MKKRELWNKILENEKKYKISAEWIKNRSIKRQMNRNGTIEMQEALKK